ncbi:hypothetical protein OEZ86_009292 [Tetradesmus obliquus]|nr:hypothetical protein OEZ86_009292 [Tetradesmus obliquus]
MAAFVNWLKDRGGYVNPKINLFNKTGSSGDRGVYAEQDIAEGEQLLLVPVPSTLHLDVEDITKPGATVPATCTAAVSQFLQAQQPPFSPFIATTVMLMAESAKGEASPFVPYFDTLPEASDCLLNWSEQERQLLAGTSLESSGRSIQDIYEADIAPKLAAAPQGMFPVGSISFEAFRRAADMVQTRAFHMKADNWLTGASQEATDELYLIPAIDMLNHSSRPQLRNTSLALMRSEAEVTLGDGSKRRFKDFFSMKAERDIPAGTQVLHTYGDLSDAQLLQTYGFIDAPPALPGAAAAAAGTGSKAAKSKSAAAAAAAAEAAGNPHNYVVLPLAMLLDAASKVAAATHLWPAKRAKKLLAAKLSLLASSGLLQQQQPQESQLLITAAAPLPDELLTIVQVLLMTEGEFKQLQQAEQEQQQQQQQQQQQGAQQQQQQRLDLGRDLLQGEFGELVATVLLQVAGDCLKRLPGNAAAAAAAMAAAAAGSRPWMAAAVALGEALLLQQLKKEGLMLMLAAQQGGDDDDDDSDDEDDEDELSDDDEDDDSGLDGSEEEAEPPAKKAKAGKQHSSKQHHKAAAAAGTEAGKHHKHSSHSKHKHEHKHKHGDKKKAAGAAEKKKKKDSRPHYGAMTGPSEEDVWQSDDSENVVGYSESEDEPASDAPAAAAAGKKRGSSSSSGKRQRHPADASGKHTYEVGAAGAVREVHGHMLGPDEADLIESDDSDKVGYVDEEEQPAAAAAAADGGSKAAGSGGRGKRSSRGGAAAAAAAAGGSKRPKKGLGFKG